MTIIPGFGSATPERPPRPLQERSTTSLRADLARHAPIVNAYTDSIVAELRRRGETCDYDGSHGSVWAGSPQRPT